LVHRYLQSLSCRQTSNLKVLKFILNTLTILPGNVTVFGGKFAYCRNEMCAYRKTTQTLNYKPALSSQYDVLLQNSHDKIIMFGQVHMLSSSENSEAMKINNIKNSRTGITGLKEIIVNMFGFKTIQTLQLIRSEKYEDRCALHCICTSTRLVKYCKASRSML